MSVITPPEDVAVVDPHEAQPSVLKRLGNTQSVWILGVLLVIVVFFSITAGSKFLSTSNFSLISQNVAVVRYRVEKSRTPGYAARSHSTASPTNVSPSCMPSANRRSARAGERDNSSCSSGQSAAT